MGESRETLTFPLKGSSSSQFSSSYNPLNTTAETMPLEVSVGLIPIKQCMHVVERTQVESLWETGFLKEVYKSTNATDISVPFGKRMQSSSSKLIAFACFPAETSPQGHLIFPVKECERTACSAPEGGQRLAQVPTALQLWNVTHAPLRTFSLFQTQKLKEHV